MKFDYKYFIILIVIVGVLTGSCNQSKSCPAEPCKPVLSSINIVDRSGFSETVNNADRLDQYKSVDFLSNQPYQKVLRVFTRDQQGNINACITSYYPNGQPKQYLEIVNNRAFGIYREWHSNGVKKLEANVIGGAADIDTSAEKSWLFNGKSCAWDDNGNLLAEILYVAGELEGTSIYYHPCGTIWKQIPCCKGQLEGCMSIYLESGVIFQTTTYVHGLKHGKAIRYWNETLVASEETYNDGYLLSGKYYNRCGALLSSIENGNGNRCLFGKDDLSEMQEYHNGMQEGEVKIFDAKGILVSVHRLICGVKHGEEIEYYEPEGLNPILKPKLSINRSEGKIQGYVKTWYPNGNMESQRDMSGNQKNGLLTAWYTNGSVMLIEKYDQDKLVKGEYFIPGEKIPISEVNNGQGIATLFDSEGNSLRKVIYHNGVPLD